MARWRVASRDVFSAEELARLRGFPEITPAELVRHFTPTIPDEAFLQKFHGRGNVLGASVQLCALPWLGFVPDEVTAVASAARQAFTDVLSAGSIVAARATGPPPFGAALFLPARAGQPCPGGRRLRHPPFPAPSGQPVRDRHADTLPLSTVFGELDGLTRFLASLLPAPRARRRQRRRGGTPAARPAARRLRPARKGSSAQAVPACAHQRM
jgi:hypothetical protein